MRWNSIHILRAITVDAGASVFFPDCCTSVAASLHLAYMFPNVALLCCAVQLHSCTWFLEA